MLKSVDTTIIRILALGFVSGLPFLLTLSTLSYWLAEQGASNTAIGLFMAVSLPYSFKFAWAPLLDHITIPFLTPRMGKRRSWLLISQVLLTLSLFTMGLCSPTKSLIILGFTATLVAFFSATQDIIIDAYRIETISTQNCGTAAAFETIGFRFGMLVSGAGALYLAHILSWQAAYHIMAILSFFSIGLTFIIPEPASSNLVKTDFSKRQQNFFKRLGSYFILPLNQFGHKDKLWLILGFIFFFKMTDTVLNSMSAPFLCDLGFSKVEFANVSKVFGITLMVVGGLLGGIMVQRLGIYQAAVMCASLQASCALMFTIQSFSGYDPYILMITVGSESLCSGMTSTIFIALLSGFCCQPHTASHFTLLYSFGSLCRVGTSALAGWLADEISWPVLFLFCFASLGPSIWFLNNILGSTGVNGEEAGNEGIQASHA
ncbi:AmpG family muropeptide MFS transporter [Candidatus Odyssella thessalonicensis]|uniref:AmpG family muropeptide MFS transporter n=1 Tax=Candidatus Odyssella thessalonicensis TaxID=84647 RepID=UPI000225BEAF|nr:MFS transporter [Candidatus Odyssella thessalonicensis]